MTPAARAEAGTGDRIWWAFAAALAADVALTAVELAEPRWITKPALMLLLLGYLLGRVRPLGAVPRLLAASLALACAADIALLVPGEAAFLTGMGLFGLMQLGYIAVFVRLGALPRLRSRRLAPVLYAALWIGSNVALWPSLGALAGPVAAYSLLLVAMAAVAAGLDGMVTAGAALFVVSDLMLGLGVAGVDVPLGGPAVMLTYGTAQLLILLGCMRVLQARAEGTEAD